MGIELSFEILRAYDQKIRLGQESQVLSDLVDVRPHQVPKHLRFALAEIYRRLGQPESALKLLHSLVEPMLTSKIDPNSKDLLEYAAALSSFGIAAEGIRILNQLDPRVLPKVFLYRGLANLKLWDYKQGKQEFENFLAVEQDPYWRLVASANLLSCQIYLGNVELAQSLLKECRETSEKQNNNLILSYSYQQEAQLLFSQKEYAKAFEIIQKVIGTGDNISPHRKLLNLKWQTNLEILNKNVTNEEAEKLLLKLRAEALKLNSWETLRDCDRFWARELGNNEIFQRVLFGTPYKSFKESLIQDSGINPPETYELKNFSDNESTIVSLDLVPGEEGLNHNLKPGQVVHRTLMALFSDFYAPMGFGRIHNLIFPEEYYNPLSSPARVSRCIFRVRQWLMENNIPITIAVVNNTFITRLGKGAIVKLAFHEAKDSCEQAIDIKNQSHCEKLKSTFGKEAFSAKETAELLSISHRSANRVMKELQEAEVVEKLGKGPMSKYKLAA